MKTRSSEPELLDLETPPPEERERIAGYLAFVNRWLGGTAAVAHHLRDIKEPVTVLDVAAGAAAGRAQHPRARTRDRSRAGRGPNP